MTTPLLMLFLLAYAVVAFAFACILCLLNEHAYAPHKLNRSDLPACAAFCIVWPVSIFIILYVRVMKRFQ